MSSRPISKLNQWEEVITAKGTVFLGKVRVIFASCSSRGQSPRAGRAPWFIHTRALPAGKDLHPHSTGWLLLPQWGQVLCYGMQEIIAHSDQQKGTCWGISASSFGIWGFFLHQLLCHNNWNCMSHTLNLISSWFPLFVFWSSQPLFR